MPATRVDHPEWAVASSLPDGASDHTLMFAIAPRNLALPEELAINVSTPGHPRRGRYLSYDEAHALVANPAATRTVVAWLEAEPGVAVTSVHPHGRYISARGAVACWNASSYSPSLRSM